MLSCSTTVVLEMPRLEPWLDCAGLQYNFSIGNVSFGVMAGWCWVVIQHSTTLILEMSRFRFLLDYAGL